MGGKKQGSKQAAVGSDGAHEEPGTGTTAQARQEAGSDYQTCSSSPSQTQTDRSEAGEHAGEGGPGDDALSMPCADEGTRVSAAQEERRSDSQAAAVHGDGSTSQAPAEQANAGEKPSGLSEQDAWGGCSKHFIILTSAGKPIYSRHGDEDALAG